jgi:glucose/arabinose dehydrogenase
VLVAALIFAASAGLSGGVRLKGGLQGGLQGGLKGHPAEPALAQRARVPRAQPWPTIALVEEVGGLTRPLYVTHAGDGSGRLFVVERDGTIRISKDGTLNAVPFLDISSQVSTNSEQGLLSVAFPPEYATHGFFVVYYTDNAGDTVVARYQTSADPDVADPDSEHVVLTVDQPAANHNGGLLKYGPDGYLYIGLGDGGGAGDTYDNAQTTTTLLGSLLRIDVPFPETTAPLTVTDRVYLPLLLGDTTVGPYLVPPTNPYTQTAGFRPEIWAYGLRNPWRYSFDRLTGDLYIGDVGQSTKEEIDFQPAAAGGENYGWPIWEGTFCYDDDYLPAGCTQDGFTFPVLEYDNPFDGRAVTGGYVYRGPASELDGIYIFGDYTSGTIWGGRQADASWEREVLTDTAYAIVSFGEDEAGNVYVVDWGGTVYKVTVATR